MTSRTHPALAPVLLKTGRTVATNALFWLMLSLIGAVGAYSDAMRSQHDIGFLYLFECWCWDYVPAFVLGLVLQLINNRWPDCCVSAPHVLIGYLAVVLLFLPVDLVFIAAHHLIDQGATVSPASAWARTLEMRRFTWFIELAWISGTYVTVVALCVWRRHRERERSWLQTEHDNVSLRLQNLRGQLEPHFMFNALNAISALVRQDDRALALKGIRQLSDLLRYALVVSEQKTVTLADELRFTRDYLALQRLRYRDRLRVHIEGDSGDLLGADCPPLLLQPLVENALRHGPDHPAGQLDIHMAFMADGDALCIRIVNPIMRAGPANPGSGTGLRNVQARLQIAYGDAAQLRAAAEGDRFVVEIRMPMETDGLEVAA